MFVLPPIYTVEPGTGVSDLTYEQVKDIEAETGEHPDVGGSFPGYFSAAGHSPFEGGIAALLSHIPPITSSAGVDEADSGMPDSLKALAPLIGSWWDQMFETSEKAAVLQANRNENAAFSAWLRSEQAADHALQRARQLRQTSYQDAVSSLKAAGLNPVLAAGGGISGSAVTAPQASAPSSSSSMASGLNIADLLTAFAGILTSAGNVMKGISSFLPSNIISTLIKG